ncbi:hypothetical protein [Ruminococcus sp.]|uniref:hypothetical protein n=1 Tax=Ruminococcus sp. TaxID=41978 RepID=UPI0025FDD803|nr:hypothetical protein [Ruminococcus sp.]
MKAIAGTSYDEAFMVAIPSSYEPGKYIVYRTYGDGLVIYNYQNSVPDNCKVVQPEPDAVKKQHDIIAIFQMKRGK